MSSRFSRWWRRILVLGSVIGPGIIAANADNDAGGIATYSVVGAHFGTSMLWVLFIITFALAVTQEIGARIGMVTRQGLAGIIRENFGVSWTMFVMLLMLVANLSTISAEFAGFAASFSLIGWSKYLVVPIMASIVWLVLYKGSFRATQRIFLILSLFYIVYIVNGFIVHPNFSAAVQGLVTPTVTWNAAFLTTMIALIGTTITPWGQFFIQSYVVDKGVDMKHYNLSKMEIYFGAFLTNFISFFIIISTATVLFPHGIHITDAGDAAMALVPLAGKFAGLLFGFGLFSASFLGACILPVATAYAICEAFGWESGFDTTWKNGREFYSIILCALVFPAALVLIPGISLVGIMVLSQNVNGILLPFILIFVMKIVNNKRIMGDYTNTLVSNVVAWTTIISLIFITILLLGAWFLGYM